MPDRLPSGLYGIVGPADGDELTDDRLLALADAFLAGGAPVIQLRHKTADARRLLSLARLLAERCRQAGALFIVNDRLDIALLAGADGVHLGQDDLPVEEARKVAGQLGRRLLVGLSTHDTDQVREGVRVEADYLGFGPVFTTGSKAKALEARGCDQLFEAVQAAGSVPVVAIGGVTLERAGDVARAGAAMGAVISDVARASDPIGRARALHAALRQDRHLTGR